MGIATVFTYKCKSDECGYISSVIQSPFSPAPRVRKCEKCTGDADLFFSDISKRNKRREEHYTMADSALEKGDIESARKWLRELP